MLVHDIDAHVADWAAQRNPVAVGRPVHHLVVGVIRGLRQPVRVDQLDPGLGREPSLNEFLLQRLAGDRHVPQVRQLPGTLLQSGQHHFQVRGHDLQDGGPAADDGIEELAHVQDGLLLHQQDLPARQQRGHQLPQRDVEALRGDLGDHPSLADLQVVDLGVQVVDQAGVLAHRALGLAGGAGGEVDIGELIGRDDHAEVAAGVVLLVGRPDEQHLDSRPGIEGLAQRGGAARLGQDQLAPGPGQHGADAVGREMRLDGQVHAAGLEHRQDGRDPVQGALGHHRYDPFAAQPSGLQRSGQPVRAGIELGVGPVPVALNGRHRVRACLHPLLEQLMGPAVGQLAVPSGQPFELETELLGGQQGLPAGLGLQIRGDQRQRGEVVAGDPGGAAGVHGLGPVLQPQHEPAPVGRDSHPQHDLAGELAVVTRRIKHGLEGRPGQAKLPPQLVDREVLVGQQLPFAPVGVAQQSPP